MKTIFTIGYEGIDIDRFVSVLQDARISVLADVRAVTVSRKQGFSKNKLRQRLARAGIEYVHMRDLGDPKPGREAARAGRYDTFRAIYGQHLASFEAQSALAALTHIVTDRSTCLMCYERDPSTCHRSIVAQAISSAGLQVRDLFGDGGKPTSHAAVRKSRRSHQGIASA